jgi:ATP phosphoribosyltransferase
MRDTGRLRIAIQKSGRLAEKSVALFAKCGLDFDFRKDRLLHECKEFPIDLMLVRDDDIPEYVADGVCDLGVVGENVIRERLLAAPGAKGTAIETVMKLGFGSCRLSIAVPEQVTFGGPADLAGKRIATSYPNCLGEYLAGHRIEAKIVELSGSVEIGPSLGIADAICDLVSTGGTLRSNGLKEAQVMFESQAALIRTARPFAPAMASDFERLLKRMDGVLKAAQAKYIMMNAPRSALDRICKIIPGMEEPSVMPLGTDGERIAIHAVARENIFWETIESLKAVGASSILVLPIEKVIA